MKRFFLFASLFTGLNIQAQTTDSSKHTISFSYDYNHFQKQFSDDWHIGSFEYKRQFSKGAVLGRLNYGNRLNQSGWQGEIEAYPVLSKKVYAFAGVGYANQMPVFPKWRSGLSLYVSLPKAWEVEGGIRQLHFTESIWLGTAGLSKYVGNWLFSARTYFAFEDLTNNQSYFASARRYFNNGIDYAWMQAGSGVSPDESRNIQIGSINNLSSKRIMVGSKLTVAKRMQALLSVGWSRNEYQKGIYDKQLNTTIGLSQRF
jgi:YaiO family outer membrane protein